MPTKKKAKAVRVRFDRNLPKKLQLRHASLVARLDHALAEPKKPAGTGTARTRGKWSSNALVDAFLNGVYCGQTAQLLDDTTQYLHDNWNQLPEETRNAMEKQVVDVLNNYVNNC